METPDTWNYFWLGFGITLVVLALYILSLWARQRNLERDLETLQSLTEDPQKTG